MAETSVCNKCHEQRPLSCFYVRKDGKPQGICKICWKKRGAAYYEANKERYVVNARIWRAANPDKASAISRRWRKRHQASARSRFRARTYGVTDSDVVQLLEEQGGRCPVCESDTPTKAGWCVDHDHLTEKVRGILCNRCNTALGHLRDSPAAADRAAIYLRSHGK